MPNTNKPGRGNYYPDEMPFQAIKRRAQKAFKTSTEFCTRFIPDNAPDNAKEVLHHILESGLEKIELWDVRCVGLLIEQFPSCVPRSWRKAKLKATIADSSGQWIVTAMFSKDNYARP
jgi:hypothetical protein